MRSARILEVPGLGKVRFKPRLGARRLRIRVIPFDIPEVTVPGRVALASAVALTGERRKWIQRQQRMNRSRETARLELGPETGDLNPVKARTVLKSRLEELARNHGFAYSGMSVRAQKTRWGSCSANNMISLNIQLLVLPPRLRDYVLLHELVHTRIKNHGPEFWTSLDRYVGDSRRLRSELGNIALQPR